MELYKDIKTILNNAFGKSEEAIIHELVTMFRTKYIPDQSTECVNDMDWVVSLVSDHTGLMASGIKGLRQHKPYVQARYMCWDLLLRRGYSQNGISKYFVKNHATISLGLRRFKNDLATDKELTSMYASLVKRYEELTAEGKPKKFVGKWEAIYGNK